MSFTDMYGTQNSFHLLCVRIKKDLFHGFPFPGQKFINMPQKENQKKKKRTFIIRRCCLEHCENDYLTHFWLHLVFIYKTHKCICFDAFIFLSQDNI